MKIENYNKLVENKKKLIKLLNEINRKPLADKINNCGCIHSVYKCTHHDHTVYARNRVCKNRFCPLCTKLRWMVLYKKYQEGLKLMNQPYLLTLTAKNIAIDKFGVDSITRFREWFNAYKKKLKGIIKGGIYSFEVTYNESRNDIHLHLHALIDLEVITPREKEKFVEFQKNLYTQFKETWEGITDGEGQQIFLSFISDKNRDKSIKEVLKYCVVPSQLFEHPLVFDLLIDVFYKKRLVQSFGSLYNFKIDDTKGFDSLLNDEYSEEVNNNDNLLNDSEQEEQQEQEEQELINNEIDKNKWEKAPLQISIDDIEKAGWQIDLALRNQRKLAFLEANEAFIVLDVHVKKRCCPICGGGLLFDKKATQEFLLKAGG